MEGSVKDLANIRIERAEEMLISAKKNLEQDELRTSLNRSYYAIFHALRSVNSLEGFDSSKHSGVIAHFNEYTLKTRKMDPKYSEYIKKASYCEKNLTMMISTSYLEKKLKSSIGMLKNLSKQSAVTLNGRYSVWSDYPPPSMMEGCFVFFFLHPYFKKHLHNLNGYGNIYLPKQDFIISIDSFNSFFLKFLLKSHFFIMLGRRVGSLLRYFAQGGWCSITVTRMHRKRKY